VNPLPTSHRPLPRQLPVSRIIFWQPFASPHQEAFLEAVAEQFPGEVILGVEQDLPAKRAAQGWRKTVHARVKVVDISIPSNHTALASHRGSDSLHVFTGFFSHPLVWAAFHKLKSSQARLAIYSEAPEQPLLTGWLKRLRGRWLAARYAKRLAFVLAVGGVGCEFFDRIGFPKEKIIPFGYYLAVPPLAAAADSRPKDTFRFISAGQLIHRKGIDLLIEACATLPKTGWHLDIYGDGPDRRSLEQLAARLGLADRVTFHGMVSSDAVQKALAMADCAVLPSRFDGWGTLVNEALAAGTPAICTSSCGSATLLADIPGAITPAAAEPLAAALSHALKVGVAGPARREQFHDAVAAHGSAEIAAHRFAECVSLVPAG
jgi:glycosyltransferase involved in cell wall biosynthesis